MAKDILGNPVADTSVSIQRSEYEALLRESETLRIITELLKKEAFLPEATIRTILGIGDAEGVGVATTFFNTEPPEEGE